MTKAVRNGEGGVSDHVTIINKVFDLHRRQEHYSIKKLRPSVYESFIKKLQDVPLDILEESLDIYKGVKRDKGALPHPNYFLKVALNKFQQKQEELEDKPTKPIWGKTI